MGMAICFKCGSAKSGALVACRGCGAAPQTDNEYAASLALSEHVSSKEQLTQYSHELRNGERLSVPRKALAEALDALKDPQLLAMLRACMFRPGQNGRVWSPMRRPDRPV